MDGIPPRGMMTLAAPMLPWPEIAMAQSPGTAAPAFTTGVVQMVLGLALVLVLLLGSLWLLRRLSAAGGAGGGLLRIVAGVAVGPRERVVLLEVGETWLVLGVAPGQVNALHQLPRSAVPLPSTTDRAPRSFPLWLDKAVERRNGKR